jgi:hypothetical protein
MKSVPITTDVVSSNLNQGGTGSGALVSMKGSPVVGKNDVLYISVLQHNLHYIYVRDRPFNLKGGGLWFFVSFRDFFSNTRLKS